MSVTSGWRRNGALAILWTIGLMALVVGRADAASDDADEAVARDFLRAAPLDDGTWVDPDQLQLVTVTSSLASTHVTFDQYVHAVRVYGGRVVVHRPSDGSPMSADGHFEPDAVLVSVTPAVDSATATDQALHSVGVIGDWRGQPRAELVIYRHEDTLLLAWQIDLPARQPLGDWQVLVDAQTGDTLHISNRLRRGA